MTVDEIRAQMRVIRRDLRANVQGIVVNANQLFDWKNYVRSFPWLTLGAAALVGYLLVPRRKYATLAIPKKTQESIENLRQEIHAAVAPPPPAPAPSLVATLLPVVGGIALKLGTSYLTRMAGNWLEQATRGAANAESAQAPSQDRTVRFPTPR
jgi:hypothetical protein